MEPASTTLLRFDAELLAAIAVPVGALAFAALVSKDAAFRRAALRWFIPFTLVWFAPCWLTGRSPVAFDLLEGEIPPWRGTAPFAMQGNGLLADVPLQFVPWREVATEAWRAGELPALNRFAGGGSPLWANPQAAVLAPATILGIAFSSFAWPLFAAVLRLLTALCGMYLFMRSERLGEMASIAAATAWGFGAALTAFALFPHANVMTLLPWLLLSIGMAVGRGGPRGVAAAALVLALMLVGGHPESVLHCAFVAIPWAIRGILVQPIEGRARAAGRCVALGVLALMLAAPAVVPFALQLRFSERLARLGTETALASAPKLTIENLTPFVLPGHYFHTMSPGWDGDNFNEAATQYVGLAALMLALTAAIVVPRKVRFWTIVAGACLLLCFEWAGTESLAQLVPWFGRVLHGRLRFVVAFALAAMAAHGIDAVTARVRGAGTTLAIAAGGGAALVALALVANATLYAEHGTQTRVVIAGVAAAVAAWATAVLLAQGRLAALLPIVLFADLAASLVEYNAPVSRTHYFPDSPSVEALAGGGPATRVMALGGALMPNSGAMYRLEQLGVNDPMAFEPFVALLRSAGYDTRFYFNRFGAVPPRILLEYLGVSRIYAGPGARIAGLPEIHRGADGTVVSVPGALPRYFVPTRVEPSDVALQSFKQEQDARVVFIDGAGEPVAPASATVAVERYGRNEATIDVSATGTSFVASSEIAMPGWELERAGAPWPLVRVNGLFLGWPVPAGSSRFVLRYRPPGLDTGTQLALISVVVLLGWALVERRASNTSS